TADEHTLVLTDTRTGHVPCPEQPSARFEAQGGYGDREATVTAFRVDRHLRPAQLVLRDYHFQMPDRSLEVTRGTPGGRFGQGSLEMFDYPGRYAQRFNKPEKRLENVGEEGNRLVQWHMQETTATEVLARGESYCWGFTPGHRFDLTNHDELEGEWLLT